MNNTALMQDLSAHDRLLVRDLRNQPTGIAWLYLTIAVTAAIGLWLVDAPPPFGTGAMFLCGALAGFAVEKLVTQRIRRVAWQLFVHNRYRFPGE